MKAKPSSGISLELIITGDGSHTLYVQELQENYHSKYGAIAESRHIFIEAGLHFKSKPHGKCNILEVGFGTGLNTLLTFLEAERDDLSVNYTTLEPYPLPESVFIQLNYPELLDCQQCRPLFTQFHTSLWNRSTAMSRNFLLTKRQITLQDYIPDLSSFDLVYFDAFGPDIQPEMWTKIVFDKLAGCLKPGGILVTYSTKGTVKRSLMDAGFSIRKLPGPRGKREILRATRL